MKFIRKNGHVVPIRDNSTGQRASGGLAAASGTATMAAGHHQLKKAVAFKPKTSGMNYRFLNKNTYARYVYKIGKKAARGIKAGKILMGVGAATTALGVGAIGLSFKRENKKE